MADRDPSGPAATAKVGTHPIHPMLVPFPIVLLISTLLGDIAFWWTGSTFFAQGSLWLLGFALVMAAAAAVAGFTDFLGNARIRSITSAWEHMIGNLVAVVLAAANFLYRLSAGAEAIIPWGLLLSAAVVVLLVYTGWKGGSLVYDHRVGVQPAQDAVPHPPGR